MSPIEALTLQVNRIADIAATQQAHIDQLYQRIQNLESAIANLANETRFNGSYIAGQISMRDGR